VSLALLGALSIVPPYLGPAIGLELDVPANVEVVDHVVPGVAIVLGAAMAALLARRGEEGSLLSMALTGWCFLEDYLSASEATGPVVEDPAELKRPWLYGFFVRACEEALPEGVSLGEGE